VTRCSLVGMGSEQPEGNPRYSPSWQVAKMPWR
jgi:hypothetical protein